MDKERSMIIKALKSHKRIFLDIWNRYIPINPKDSNASVETRKKGNSRYMQKSHDVQAHQDIFTLYCKSIALAPLKSEELALAYGNRSAFLFHINKYEYCIEDIDKALEITTSNNALKVKLLHRKIECLNNLGLCECQKLFEVVQSLGNNIDGYNDKEIGELIAKLKTSKQEQKNEERNVPETDNVQDFVTIENNKQYGRHLVAAKDYEPGDIILVEKLVASSLNSAMTYTCCHYCYKTCWSSIPCNKCSWVMFCSECCREKAWEAYHDVECALIPFLSAFSSVRDIFGICIRILIMAVKGVDGLAELRAALQSMDQCNDEDIRKSFLKKNLRSIYFLKSDGVSEFLLETVSKAIITPLIGLVKHTQLIQNFDYKKTKDFTDNEDILFIGSLLIKLGMIKIINSFEFTDEICHQLQSVADEQSRNCKGVCLVQLSSLINHSCVPNVGKCFTTDQKLIIYALQPIKKSSQIFITYNCNFYSASAIYRQQLLKQYNFTCTCKACKESWPPLCEYKSGFQSNLEILEIQFYNDCQGIFQALDSGKTYFEKKNIKLLSKKIKQALKSLKQPSYISCIMDQAMSEIFARMYLVPQFSFEKC